MPNLHEQIGQRVNAWRAAGYPCDEYPSIAEILEFSVDPEHGLLRYLRRPQLRALEAYWYLRLIERTPRVFDLYQKYLPPRTAMAPLLEALGIPEAAFRAANFNAESLWERVRTDNDFVRDFGLEAVRETLTLPYPSYILALAMGAGKTVLIGAILATEFGMALDYPAGPFVQNALVFAPGKTIIESLRELAEVRYDKILPPRLYKGFSASMKLTITKDGEKDIPVIQGSIWNVIITNTEKIRIQKEAQPNKKDIASRLLFTSDDDIRGEVANLRLRTIASLPHLAVISDEAHHTYGQSLESGLKRVRQTVDYLAQETNVVCVVNTTGTPYFQRQPLRDVVVWYGLSQGIKDNILKDVAGNIRSYDFAGDASRYVAEVIRDFFKDYSDVRLANGAQAKIAIYFPQTKDLKDLKPVVETALVELGLSPAVVLVNTSDESITKKADEDAFNRLNDPHAPHRVILLVNKGTEGWNCPSLFACALARELTSSNNFVLQAATRCLRQTPGNTRKARIYLSTENYKILDRQLKETYGETILDFNRAGHESVRAQIVLQKVDLPPVVVSHLVRRVVRKELLNETIALKRPNVTPDTLKRVILTPAEGVSSGVLQQIGDGVEIDSLPPATDVYTAATDLSSRYRLDVWLLIDALRTLYHDGEVPLSHLDPLAEQLEKQLSRYEVKDERVDVALALVRPEGFRQEQTPEGATIYTADIVYPRDREAYILHKLAKEQDNHGGFGFHYDPYNFDSMPEVSFFETLLFHLNINPTEVEDVYYTGALTDPSQTDFFVEYKDEKGKWRRYTPDFLIRKKPRKGGKPGTGRVLIVEIKAERDMEDPIEGDKGRKALALRKWQTLNPDHIRYEMIFATAATVSNDQMRRSIKFTEELEK